VDGNDRIGHKPTSNIKQTGATIPAAGDRPLTSTMYALGQTIFESLMWFIFLGSICVMFASVIGIAIWVLRKFAVDE